METIAGMKMRSTTTMAETTSITLSTVLVATRSPSMMSVQTNVSSVKIKEKN